MFPYVILLSWQTKFIDHTIWHGLSSRHRDAKKAPKVHWHFVLLELNAHALLQTWFFFFGWCSHSSFAIHAMRGRRRGAATVEVPRMFRATLTTRFVIRTTLLQVRNRQRIPKNQNQVLYCLAGWIGTSPLVFFLNLGRWYKFEDELGNPQQLVDFCVTHDHCGTAGPVFLTESHPDVGMSQDMFFSKNQSPFAGQWRFSLWWPSYLTLLQLRVPRLQLPFVPTTKRLVVANVVGKPKYPSRNALMTHTDTGSLLPTNVLWPTVRETSLIVQVANCGIQMRTLASVCYCVKFTVHSTVVQIFVAVSLVPAWKVRFLFQT